MVLKDEKRMEKHEPIKQTGGRRAEYSQRGLQRRRKPNLLGRTPERRQFSDRRTKKVSSEKWD